MASPRLHFLGFVLHSAEYRLDRDGVPIEVEPKVLDVLLYLIEHRDRVVPRGELISAVWAGVKVSAASLSRAIREVRRVLGDTGDEQRAIRTVQRRGFQFVAEVREDPAHASREVPMLPAPAPGLGEPPREEQMCALTALPQAFEGLTNRRGALCLLCGEPGMGKSRALSQLGAILAERGVITVAAAVPDDDRAPPLWPWLEVSRRLPPEHPRLPAHPALPAPARDAGSGERPRSVWPGRRGRAPARARGRDPPRRGAARRFPVGRSGLARPARAAPPPCCPWLACGRRPLFRCP